MTAGRSEQLRDLWLPALVGLVGALLSVAGWGVLVAERRAQLLDTTTQTAAGIREAVEQSLERQAAALFGLAELWSSFGLRPQPEWKENVGQRVDQLEGVEYVAWVDLDQPRKRIAIGGSRSSGEIEVDVAAARAHADRPQLAGPLRDASGAVGYRIYLPVRTPEDHAGVLVARFGARPLLAAVLQARARGYALSVLWDGVEIYARGEPSDDRWQRWWRVEETLELPLGGRWRVVHRPTAEYAAAQLTPLPHYLLATGIVLSAALAVLVHQLRLTVRQSRFLAASNRSLEQRGAELESRVSERTEELEEAVSELEAFNYSVSHDLRSPLGAILNFVAILEEDYRGQPLGAEGMAILARIRRSATRATALLEDLLELSRAGRAAVRPERLDMTALAHEAFAQARAAQGEDEVEFFVDPLPEAVGDRSLLGDVLVNLFSNALKYSRGCEKRRVTVTGRIEDGECVYEVADNGQGFDMRFAGKLFGLFERLHSDDDVEGTGVGLAMVGRIVKRHGGRVWAEGQPGRGARFSFALPRTEAA